MTSKDRPAETGLWQIARIGSRDRVVANAGRMAARHETAVADVARGVPRVAVRIVGEEHRPKGVVPGEIIVHRKDRAAAEKLLGDALVRVEEPACDLPVVKLVTEIHQDRVDDALRRLSHAGVAANPNHVLPFAMRGKAGIAPGMASIGVRPADDTTGAGVRVVVIDTGIDAHASEREDGWLDDIEVTWENTDPLNIINEEQGEKAADGPPYLDDAAGHGSFVAGIIRQVAPACEVVMMRALDSDGVGSEEALACAILAAGRMKPRPAVINLSLGQESIGGRPPVAIAAALESLDDDIIVVAAAGNTPDDEPTWPAGFRRVVAVAGLTGDGRPASWSKYGDWVDCAAVAEELVSTFVGGVENPARDSDGVPDTWSGKNPAAVWIGTSFAAPRIAGLIAAGVSGGMTPRDAYAALLQDAPHEPGYGHLITG
ncbi:MAG: S8/S53 family peptidase [Actinobacteria bacterium]|nr:S8/S53 family peptidase [Actinomycetota bacterium]